MGRSYRCASFRSTLDSCRATSCALTALISITLALGSICTVARNVQTSADCSYIHRLEAVAMDLILSPSTGETLESIDVHPKSEAVLAELSRSHIVGFSALSFYLSLGRIFHCGRSLMPCSYLDFQRFICCGFSDRKSQEKQEIADFALQRCNNDIFEAHQLCVAYEKVKLSSLQLGFVPAGEIRSVSCILANFTHLKQYRRLFLLPMMTSRRRQWVSFQSRTAPKS